MRQNSARRIALLDAAIEVLAADGSRGLTLRAVDRAAAVPAGTASNYFTDRSDLLGQVAHRVRERLTPDPGALAVTMRADPDRELLRTLMRQLLDRMRSDRGSHLALLELRLEATRRPSVNAPLTEFFSADLAANIAFHADARLPGDSRSVLLLYLGMLGLIVEDLTMPSVIRPHDVTSIADDLVDRLFPLR